MTYTFVAASAVVLLHKLLDSWSDHVNLQMRVAENLPRAVKTSINYKCAGNTSITTLISRQMFCAFIGHVIPTMLMDLRTVRW